ncbi:unnamed protein product [Discula destructiva]
MAFTAMSRLLQLTLLTSLSAWVQAATVTYDFDIGWVTANPDGVFDRPVIGINGQWPIPTITADVGDRVIVNVMNSLGNQSTSLHFHGLFQNGTAHMDGPVGVSQCEIPPGSSFKYDFNITQPGTYWYHSHLAGQYPDGLRGPLIINDPDSPFAGQYDEELVLSVSDWYHEQMPNLLVGFMSKNNPTGAEPVPKAALFNETQNLTIAVEPGKTYLFRMVNIGAFAGQYIWFEGHNISIIEVDGIYTQPAEADRIYLSAAQRCSFLLTAKNETTANYPFVGSMDTTLFDVLPSDLNWNVTGWLVYDAANPNPDAAILEEDVFNEFDDWTLLPYDNETLLTNPDQEVTLTVIMDNLGDGANYAFFNNITYKAPKVPTLYTALSSGQDASNSAVYGVWTHPFVLEKGEIVQIVVDNADTGKHPFHLHGHAFQAVWRSEEEAGLFADSNVTEADFPQMPMRRDTFVLHPEGNIVLRFRADNPGIWLFHCHLEWHIVSGLTATMVEAPLDLQQSLTIPEDHYAACAANSPAIPTAGNAAGNTANLLDLSGEPAPPAPLPAGFTARGIVALVFSCVAGFIGVAVVAWYGLVGDPASGPEAVAAVGGASLLQTPSGNLLASQGIEQTTITSGGVGATKT